MSYPDSPAAAQFWRRRASFLSARLNFHHWLARFNPLLLGVAILGAVFDLLRREAAGPEVWSEALIVFGAAIAAVTAWLQARRHFCNNDQALVRLETVLGLHNRLSSARDGVLPWPRPQLDAADGYHANWRTILVPVLAGALFLWGAHLVPVSKVRLGSNAAISEPPEFSQVQSWINALKSDDLIEPDKLQEMQTALDKLRDRPAQDWYSQSNLEAVDSLKELTEQSMNTLSQDLDQADQTVEAMREKMETSSDAGSLQPMQDKLRAAGENLASGNLPLKREMVNQMTGADGADKALTAKQLAQLHDQLQKGKQAARTAPRSGADFSDEMNQAMAKAEAGQGPRRREGPAAGGRGGGEKTAPLELQPRDKDTPAGPVTSVGSEDMSRATLGETVKISASAHTVDPAAYHGTQAAGAAQVEGSGGESVWRSTYDPQEADVLSRFFK